MANNPQLIFLNDIKPRKTAYRIQVKIIHTWRHFMKDVGESLELILCDANGTKIHASCNKTYISEVGKHVRVGVWRNIDRFSVSAAGGAYRSTDHKYRLAFNGNTKITESTYRDDSMFLNLVDFKSIESGLLNPNFLIDVIGQVQDLGDLETIGCNGGKQRQKLEFSLVDICGQRLACCLWGKFAENLHTASQETEGMVICLLRFAKIGQYRGEFQISNSYDASQMFVNPEIPEADEFKQRAIGDSQALTLAESEENKLELQMKRDKRMHYPQRNLRELFEETEEKVCRVVATIYDIDTDWGWYYFGCLGCNNKKVFPHSKTVKKINGKETVTHIWWCEACRSKVTSVSPRFKIHLLVKDDTGETQFLLLDSIATGVVPASAKTLLNGSWDELEDDDPFPEEITNLVGQTFMFGVYIQKDNASGGCYKVGKVWKDLRMLMTSEISESYSAPAQASEEPLLIENQSDDIVSTPSSKRKEVNKEAPELHSTSKKQCTKAIKSEKIRKDKSASS
ncbi:replication protein A 70 kDa DNA-binding subunit D-like [Brassica napus]|uniref:replication protein A 70 kDa DNA-binding subunit D-like n=1 Tax=Brassica napus TaxID=3708 RepID=UPI00207918B7|nr:replication protein A 70 kDa DNA-binding subunit D-like [Brassica napus]